MGLAQCRVRSPVVRSRGAASDSLLVAVAELICKETPVKAGQREMLHRFRRTPVDCLLVEQPPRQFASDPRVLEGGGEGAQVKFFAAKWPGHLDTRGGASDDPFWFGQEQEFPPVIQFTPRACPSAMC